MTPDETLRWLNGQFNRGPDPAGWFDQVDPRCWEVLNTLQNIYNLVDLELPCGGLRFIPRGGEVGGGVALYRRTDFGTTDFDELTRLVLVAHQTACRVSVSAASFWVYLKNPCDVESGYGGFFTDYETVERLDGTEPPEWAGCEHCNASIWRAGPDAAWTHRTDPDDDSQLEVDEDHEPEPTPIKMWPMSGMLDIMVHPRLPWSDEPEDAFHRNTMRHPGLPELIGRAQALLEER